MDNVKDIGKVIKGFSESKTGKRIELGNLYYESENEKIMRRKKQFYDEKGLATDPYRANNKLASSFYKIIVKQLVGYLLGNGISITTAEKKNKMLLDTLGKKFNQKLSECAVDAVKGSVGWLHPFINELGEFDFAVVPSEQVAFKVSPRDESLVASLVRFYSLDFNGKKYMRAEEWTDADVTFYFKEGDKPYAICAEKPDADEDDPTCETQNPRPHITKTSKFGERVESVTGQGWGKIPFIPMWFDSDREYQLKPIKRHIDGYDIIQSDFMNNLEDIQDVFWIIKGYDGEDINTFMADVKKYKTLKVGEGGDARTETTEIPTEARDMMLTSLRRDIFFFGMAVDTDNVGDGSITNVVIKSRYANLDLKADDFEHQVESTVHDLIAFVNLYYGLVSGKGTPVTDYEIEFDRSMIMNEIEIMKMVDEQKGIVADETFFEHHPWTKGDVKKELKRQEDDKESNPILIPEVPKLDKDGKPIVEPTEEEKKPPVPPTKK